MSVSVRLVGCTEVPVCPGVHRLRPRRPCPPSALRAGSCWSGQCGQGAEALPAVQECLGPRPVGADGEGALAGVAGQPGRQMPDAVAERVRVRVAEFGVVAVAEEAGPGGEVGGDARRDDPSRVDLPGLGRFRRPMALAVRTPAVSTVAWSRCRTSMYCGWWLPGTSSMPESGMFVQVIEYRQPVSFS